MLLPLAVNYFCILELICILGIVVNVLFPVKNWVGGGGNDQISLGYSFYPKEFDATSKVTEEW